MKKRDTAMQALTEQGLERYHWDAVEGLLADIQSTHPGVPDLGPLEIGELETRIEEWLEAHDISNAWDMAPGLVQAGFTEERLEHLATHVPESSLASMLEWLSETLTVQESADIITRSSYRISELVNAIKGYSYMDRGTVQDANIHEGLDGALVILAHRMRNISVQRNYDRSLPTVEVFGNTLNQVWTNIIDNAIDATESKGSIVIRTRHEDGNAVVEIEDNGCGIAPANLSSIFEPFFTTKPQGQGMGLGLDNVWRIVTEEHCGTIDVESEPGRTVFRVSLPIASAEMDRSTV